MNDAQQSIAGFLDKWQARWPEWAIASVFVPQAQRELAAAWFALRNELTDAAWTGQDPRPGEAKLAWWSEELQGWEQGRRRHPLGIVLQRHAVPWTSLAASLPALLGSRERASDAHEAIDVLEPFAEGVAGISASLFTGASTPAPARSVVVGLLAERVLVGGDAAVPLHVLAASERQAPQAAARAWARELLERWPPPHEGAIPGRIHAAMVRERLRSHVAGADPARPLRGWRALLTAWRAARA
jgi:phytoene/squalene synthetase